MCRYPLSAYRWLKVIRSSIVWHQVAVVISCALFWTVLADKGSLPSWSMTTLLGEYTPYLVLTKPVEL